ncbi:MAG: exodeoxyribonuclease III [Lachnospiraceae bacterium]|nr:exodeoxyribonuclease III [Lachnospiraceae bacterium]
MKLVSWNVNGIRACVKKGFEDTFNAFDADIFCIQESKLQKGQIKLDFQGYHQYWNYAKRAGYSGTAVFSKEEPIEVFYGIGIEEHDNEGRVITLEFEDFYFVVVYTPNSQDGLKRLDYRLSWEDAFRNYICNLDSKKPVIVTGDMNVAHEEIDLKHPKSNHFNPGFSDEERGKMTELLQSGFVDSFRKLYPDKENAYSWWSYRSNARENNVGWRIDYFLVSKRWEDRIEDSIIHPEVFGSDHCPVELDLRRNR